jgi:hypothetical protein
MGFSMGGWVTFSSVERSAIEQACENKFHAAAFYPICSAIRGPVTVPTSILTSESDDGTPADACRKLVGRGRTILACVIQVSSSALFQAGTASRPADGLDQVTGKTGPNGGGLFLRGVGHA